MWIASCLFICWLCGCSEPHVDESDADAPIADAEPSSDLASADLPPSLPEMPPRPCGWETELSVESACGFDGDPIYWGLLIREPDVLDGCRYLLSDLQLQRSRMTNFAFAGDLETVSGDLLITWNGNLQSLDGLDRLQEVGGLHIEENYQLGTLAGLRNLRRVHGRLRLYSNSGLDDLGGLEAVECVEELDLTQENEWSLDSFESLERVVGDCLLGGFPSEEVEAFLARVEVGGRVVVDGEVRSE